MATYVLPDDRLTEEQRKAYFFELLPDDAVEITSYLLDNFPAVYDEAVENTGRVNRLAQIHAMRSGRAKEVRTHA